MSKILGMNILLLLCKYCCVMDFKIYQENTVQMCWYMGYIFMGAAYHYSKIYHDLL